MLYIEKVFYYLSRILAILEFKFDSKKRKFFKSNLGFYYVAVTNVILILQIFSWPNSDSTFSPTREITQNLVIFNLYLHCITIFIVNCNILYNRKTIRNILNNFLRLREMHNQVFGKPLKLLIINMFFQFVRDFCFYSYIGSFEFEWYTIMVYFQIIRLWWQCYLINIAIMLQYQFWKPLAEHMSSFTSNVIKKRELYIKYALQLIKLRQKLQIFLWPFFMYRLLVEVGVIICTILRQYWSPDLPHFRNILIKILCFSPGIHMILNARNIYRMENQILERLYVRELIDMLLKLKPQRNLKELKVCSNIHIHIYSNSFYLTVGATTSSAMH